MAKLIAWLLVIAIDIPVIMLRGFVLSVLWLWFIVPLGVSPIGIAWGIGLSILVGLFTMNFAKQTEIDAGPMEKALIKTVASAVVSLMCWGFGAIVHSFM